MRRVWPVVDFIHVGTIPTHTHTQSYINVSAQQNTKLAQVSCGYFDLLHL